MLTERGVRFSEPPQDGDWGARFCEYQDPNGVPIYFMRWPVERR